MSKKSDGDHKVDRKHAEFVVIETPEGDGALKGPYPILLDVGRYVWVPANDAALSVPDVIQVTDGRSSGFEDITCFVSVPAAWCSFVSEGAANALKAQPEPAKPSSRKKKGRGEGGPHA